MNAAQFDEIIDSYTINPQSAFDKLTKLSSKRDFFLHFLWKYILRKEIAPSIYYIEIYMRFRAFCETQPFIRLIGLDEDLIVISESLVTKGSQDFIYIKIRQLAEIAIKKGNRWIIVYHSHILQPLQPSRSDIDSTLKLASALEALGIELWDHIIVNPYNSFSLRSNGFLV